MLRKFLVIAILMGLIIQPAWAVVQFTATGVPLSTSDPASSFPAEVYNQWTILQTLLQNYRQGYYLLYNNSTSLTIGAGEVSAWNNGATASYFLQNTGSQTVTTANLDTGASFSPSTTYYAYAGSSSGTQATATISISLNNSAPSNLTYFHQLGNFTTDSSGNIAQIVDNSIPYRAGTLNTTSYTVGNTYQASTDGELMVAGECGLNPSLSFGIASDISPTPTQGVGGCSSSSTTTNVNGVWNYPIIRKGDYFKVTGNVGAILWRPLGQ